jgi:WD40 repeat protein
MTMRRAILLAAVFIAGCPPSPQPADGPSEKPPDEAYPPVSVELHRRAVLTHTTGEVRAVAFSPGGRLLAVAEAPAGMGPAGLALWDAGARRRLKQADTAVSYEALLFTPDSAELIALSRSRIDVWQVNSWRKLRSFDQPDRSWTDMDLSPDGRLLASVGWEDSNVHVFDRASGRRLRQLSGDFSAVGFSPDGAVLATAGPKALHLFDTETWEPRSFPTPRGLLAGPPIPVLDVLFGPEGGYVFTAGAMGQAWNVETGDSLGLLQPPPTIRGVALAPGRRVVAVAGNQLSLWELPGGRNCRTVAAHEGGPTAVAFCPDGETLATAGRSEHDLTLWDVTVRD